MSKAVEFFRSLRPFHFILFGLAIVGSFTVTYHQVALADCYGGTIHGRGCYRGYFTNTADYGGTNILPELSGGLAIPMGIDSAPELYDLLLDAYNSGSNQRQTGAAFIYNTMMGFDGPGTGRTVSAAEWQELRDRLYALDDAGKILWTGNVSNSINSFYQGIDAGFANDGTLDDDAFYEDYRSEAGIRILDYNNNMAYQILRRCANPMGDAAGIPETRNYTLTPRVNVVTPDELEAGAEVDVSTNVTNTGDAPSNPTRWEITKIVVQPGSAIPQNVAGGTTSGTAPCQSGGGAASGNHFQGPGATCDHVTGGTRVFNLGAPATLTANDINVGDVPAGTRVCFALSVRPRSNTDGNWAHSRPLCAIVSKKPKVQIWGGDISVRGDVETATSRKDLGGMKTFGSWVEYGLLAIGQNRGMASGSGLNGGHAGAATQWNMLTFANIDNSGASSYGYYSLPILPALSGQFINNPSSGAPGADLGALNSGTYKGANATISTSDVAQDGSGKGKSIIIVATGTVTINGNITYKGPGGSDNFTNADQLPQVIIIANAINITGGVNRIDAWLLTTGANGTINTCSDVAVNAPLTVDICSAPLTINGPLETSHLYLRRTAGSGTGSATGDPAETFNLRADAYIWARNREGEAGKAQTVYSVELPPRF
jgi:hypothetical protein